MLGELKLVIQELFHGQGCYYKVGNFYGKGRQKTENRKF